MSSPSTLNPTPTYAPEDTIYQEGFIKHLDSTRRLSVTPSSTLLFGLPSRHVTFSTYINLMRLNTNIPRAPRGGYSRITQGLAVSERPSYNTYSHYDRGLH